MGATLASGEDGLVDALLEVGSLVAVLAEEDQTSARATESLVPVQVGVSIPQGT